MESLLDVLLLAARTRPREVVFTELNRRGDEVASLTCGELQRKAAAVAAQLQQLHLTDRSVLLLLPHGLHFIIALYGCLAARCVAVPHRLPRSSDVQRLAKICSVAQTAAVLTVSSQESAIRRLLESWRLDIPIVRLDAVPELACGAWEVPAVRRDTVALIQFTSGTVRAPKGAIIRHHALLENSQAIKSAFEFKGGEVVVSWLPFTHDMGLIGHVVQPLYSGFRNVFMSPTTFVADPAVWLKTIALHRAYCSGAPNFAYRLCCERRVDEALGDLDLSCWRLAYCGAERIDPQTMQTFIARFAPFGFVPHSLFPCYGLAESTLYVTGRHGLHVDSSVSAEPCVSVGPCSADHMSLKIVDPQSAHEVGPRSLGEIWVKSTSAASGYLGDALASQQYFDCRLSAERGYLRTGDLGYVDAGQVYVVGRLKNLIKVRGLTFAAEDIELVALRAASRLQIPAHACAVFGVADRGIEEAVAMVEADIEALASDALRAAGDGIVREVCDALGVMLQAAVFVDRGKLPKTPSGKVKRPACKDLYTELQPRIALPLP